MQTIRWVALGGALYLALAAPAHALKSDKEQPAFVDADNVEVDFRTGVRTYTGNVKVRQGTLRINGDKMVVRYKDEKIQTATAYGKPATFQQRPDGKNDDVNGSATRLELNEVENILSLHENAILTQSQDSTRGDVIHYNMNSNKMTVKGGTSTGKTAGGRARVVFQPQAKQSGVPTPTDGGRKP